MMPLEEKNGHIDLGQKKGLSDPLWKSNGQNWVLTLYGKSDPWKFIRANYNCPYDERLRLP
jgi:hypothetical protein